MSYNVEPNPLLSSAVRDCWEHPLYYRGIYNFGQDISSPILAFVLKRIRHIILTASEIDEDDTDDDEEGHAAQANAKLTIIPVNMRQYISDKFEIDYKTARVFLRLTVEQVDECMDMLMNWCTQKKGRINAMLKRFIWNGKHYEYEGQNGFNATINFQLMRSFDASAEDFMRSFDARAED